MTRCADPLDDAGLRRLLRDHLDDQPFAGVLAMVRWGDDPVTVAVGTRGPGLGAAQPHDVFRFASVTKLVVALASARLVDAGTWRFDLPLAEIVGTAALQGIVDRAAVPTVTIADVLGHRSGARDLIGDPRFLERALEPRSHPWTAADLLAATVELGPPLSPPGPFRYSDTGYVLAGLALEAATGQDLPAALRSLVLGPAAMDGTWLEFHEAARGDVLHHVSDGLDLHAADLSFDWSGGGLAGPAADLLALAAALHHGHLVAPPTFSAMLPDARPVTFPSVDTAHYDAYGLGFGRVGGLLGHTGAWGSFVVWNETGAAAGTTNRQGRDRRPLFRSLEAVLRG